MTVIIIFIFTEEVFNIVCKMSLFQQGVSVCKLTDSVQTRDNNFYLEDEHRLVSDCSYIKQLNAISR